MRSSEREKQTMRERRKKLEAIGICVCCGTKSAEGNWKYCKKCADLRSARAKDRLVKTRRAVLVLYGGCCACCGETNEVFLTVDHKNNDGHKERLPGGRNSTSSEMICRRLLKKKRDDIQILCYNCNCARARVGVCPHQDPTVTLERKCLGPRRPFSKEAHV